MTTHGNTDPDCPAEDLSSGRSRHAAPPVAESIRVLHLLIWAQRVEAHIHIQTPAPLHMPLQHSRFVPHPRPFPVQHTPLVQGVKQQSPLSLQKVWGAWQPHLSKELQRTLQHSASFVQGLWSGRQEVG